MYIVGFKYSRQGVLHPYNWSHIILLADIYNSRGVPLTTTAVHPYTDMVIRGIGILRGTPLL